MHLLAVLLSLVPAQEAEAAPEDTPATGDEQLLELDAELVATASRVAEPLRLAPGSITVVPRKEIDAFGYTSTADALVGTRGISYTNDLLWPSLGIRGVNRFADYGNHMRVQIDGHDMNDDWIFSSYVANDQLTDLDMIESVELLRGPGSALYGMGAFFGVINLTTPDVPLTHRVRTSIGVIDTLTFRAHVDGGDAVTLPLVGDGGAWASVSVSGHTPLDYHSDAYVGTPGHEDGTAEGADGLRTVSALAKAKVADFTLAAGWHRRDRAYPTGAYDTIYGDPRNIVSEDRGFTELRYEPTFGAVHVAARLYFDLYRYAGVYTQPTAPDDVIHDDYWSPWGGAEVRATTQLFDSLRLITGVIYESHPYAHWTQTDYLSEQLTFHAAGLYATADWRPLTWLAVGAGARLDGWLYHSPSSVPDGPLAPLFSINPRAHVIWLPSDDDTFKLLAGRSYRAPSIYEMTYSPVGMDLSDGAPLESETILSAEAEYTRRLPIDLSATVAVYTSYVEHLIDDNLGDQFAEGYSNDPVPVFASGAEVELAKRFGDDGVFGSAFYAYQRVRKGSLIDGARERNSPEHLIGIKLYLPISGDRLGLGQRFIIDAGRLDREGKNVEPAAVWDATLSGAAAQLGDVASLRWSLGIRNLLDQRYVHPVDNAVRDIALPQPGRSISGQLSLAF